MPGLTKRALDAAKPRDKDYFLWCEATRGFGARVHPSGRKIFVAQVRVGRAIRRVGIGPYGPFTVDQARARAEQVIRAAAEGRDPQREKRDARAALTVAELCDAYLEAARAGLVVTRFRRPKRPSTVAIDEGRVARHVKPLIGHLVARDLTRGDVQRMADAIAEGRTAGVFAGKPRGRAVVTGGPGTAARVVELLGGVWSWAEKRGLVAGASPVQGVETARGEAKDRALSGAELARLGQALSDGEAAAPLAVAALDREALDSLAADGLVVVEGDEARLPA
jgi:hypothetical protein